MSLVIDSTRFFIIDSYGTQKKTIFADVIRVGGRQCVPCPQFIRSHFYFPIGTRTFEGGPVLVVSRTMCF